METRRFCRMVSICVFLFVSVAICEASNIQSAAIGARSRGMNGAYLAVANDPTAIYWNPAGLTKARGTILQIGTSLFFPKAQYTPPGGGTERTKDYTVIAPFLGFSVDYYAPVTLGFAVYSPYGLEAQWSEEAAYSFSIIEGTTALIHFAPSIAWKLSPQLSLGLALAYARGSMESKVNAGAPGVELHGEGDGGNVAGNVGVLYSPNEALTLGLVWRSATKIDFKGTAQVTGAPKDDLKYTFTFPQNIGLGVAYNITPKWLLAMDVNWVDWSVVEEEVFDFKDNIFSPDDITLPRRWKDTYQWRVGMEYILKDRWMLRGGYAYDPSPVPSETLDPAYLDGDQQILCLGGGYRVKLAAIDLAYEYIFFNRCREVTKSIHIPPTDGKYKGSMHTVELALSLHF